VRDFSSIVAPIIEVLEGKTFEWNDQAHLTFEEIKRRLPFLPGFSKVFEVEWDASGVGIGVVLSSEKQPIAYFRGKLNDTYRKYSTYDREFYTIVMALEH